MVAMRFAGENPGVSPLACWFLSLLCESKMISCKSGVISTNSASAEQRTFHSYSRKCIHFSHKCITSSIIQRNLNFIQFLCFDESNATYFAWRFLSGNTIFGYFLVTYKNFSTCDVHSSWWTDAGITILVGFDNDRNEAQN